MQAWRSLQTLSSLCDYELGFDSELRDFGGVANSRFELFKGWQIQRGVELNAAQLEFLTHIKDYIIQNAWLSSTNPQSELD